MTLKINVFDETIVTENLTNYKRWFNGMKSFSSVKVEPARYLKELIIRVSDKSRVSDKVINEPEFTY